MVTMLLKTQAANETHTILTFSSLQATSLLQHLNNSFCRLLTGMTFLYNLSANWLYWYLWFFQCVIFSLFTDYAGRVRFKFTTPTPGIDHQERRHYLIMLVRQLLNLADYYLNKNLARLIYISYLHIIPNEMFWLTNWKIASLFIRISIHFTSGLFSVILTIILSKIMQSKIIKYIHLKIPCLNNKSKM